MSFPDWSPLHLTFFSSVVQSFIPMMTASMFSGFVTHKLTGSDNSDWGSAGPHSTGSTNTNSSTSNTRRDLGPDPASLYMAVRTSMDNRDRAPSDGPVRPKRESELESESSDYVASHPVFKREPVPEDGVLGLPCSLLKRVPETEPLKDSRLCVHPHGQAPDITSHPRSKREPETWEDWATNVGNYYANKYGSPDDVPGLAHV